MELDNEPGDGRHNLQLVRAKREELGLSQLGIVSQSPEAEAPQPT